VVDFQKADFVTPAVGAALSAEHVHCFFTHPPVLLSPLAPLFLYVVIAALLAVLAIGGHVLPVEGLEYGGGNVFDDGRGHTVATANITPDPTGISYYDESLFVEVMHTGRVRARKLDDAMPWWAFRGMTDEDLKAVFAYLRTLKPASHRVDNTEPPTFCKVCKQKHGGGDRN
jgi:hypothetical protein